MAGKSLSYRLDLVLDDKASPAAIKAARSLVSAQGQVARATAELSRLQEAGLAGTDAYAKASNDLTLAQDRLATAQRRVVGSMNTHTAAVGRAEKSTRGLHSATAQLGGLLAAGAIVGGLKSSTKAAADYQQTVTEVKAVSGATHKQLLQLSAAAKHVGTDFAIGAQSSIGAVKELTYGGVKIRDVLGGALKQTAVLAKAGGIEMTAAAQTMAQAIAVYGLHGSQAKLVADSLANAAAHTTGTIGSFSEGLDAAAGAAKPLHLSLGQVVTMLDLLQKGGKTGAEGGTTLKTALVHLAHESKAGAALLQQYNIHLFTQAGHLKSVAGLSDALTHGFAGMNRQQLLSAEATLAGQRGLSALSAIMSVTGTQANALESSITKQGTAARLAAGNLSGYSEQWGKVKAQLGTLKINFGTEILNGVAGARGGLLSGLENPQLVAGVNKLGAQLGSQLGGAIAGISKGLADGTIQRELGQIATVGGEVAHVFGEVAHVGGGFLNLISQIPGPVLQAAFAFRMWRSAVGMVAPSMAAAASSSVAAANVMRGIPNTAVAGEAAAVRAAGGSGAGSMAYGSFATGGGAGSMSFTAARIRQREAAAAQQAAVQAEQRAEAALQSSYRSGALFIPGGGQVLQSRQLAASATTAAAAERVAAQSAMRSSLMPSGRGVGGAIAAGAIGTAMGGSFLSKVAAGAAVGSLGGPWGIAGGAVAAAAGAGIEAVIKKSSDAAAKRLTDAVNIAAAGGSAAQHASAKSAIQTTQTQRAKSAMGEGGSQSAVDAAQAKLGHTIAAAQIHSMAKFQHLDPTTLLSNLGEAGSAAGVGDAARKQAAIDMAAYVGEAQKRGRISAADMHKVIAGLYMGTGNGANAGGAINVAAFGGQTTGALKAQLSGQLADVRGAMKKIGDSYQGLAPAAKVGFGNASKAGWTELHALQQRIKGASGDTKKSMEQDASNLQDALIKFAQEGKQPLSDWTTYLTMQMAVAKDAIGAVSGQLGTVSNSLTAALGTAAGTATRIATPKKKAKGHRTGGLLGFATGGLVPALVSSGEEIIGPGGQSLGIVPGQRVAADNVAAMLPAGGTVLTDHGQALRDAGMSLSQVRAHQLPHFAGGGTIGPARAGQVARDAGFKGQDLVTAIAVSGAESGWRPGDTNLNSDGSTDRGLWQINSVHKQFDFNRLFLPGYNARAAWSVSNKGRNWLPWVTYNNGAYKQFLPQARAAAGKVKGGGGSFSSTTVNVPLLLGDATTGRGPLVPDALSQGIATGIAGWTHADLKKYGAPILPALSQALAAGKYYKQVTVQGGGSAASRSGKAGSTQYDGQQIAAWMVPELNYAKKHGWSGRISSGVRTLKQQQYLWDNAAKLGLIRGVSVAKPGTSNHEGTAYPKGAIDTPDWQAMRTAIAGYKGPKTLKWRGMTDAVHFSGDGHRRGGLIRAYAGGGKIGAASANGGGAVLPQASGLGPLGGMSLRAGLSKGQNGAWYERLALAADDALYARLAGSAAALQKIALGHGDAKMIARARAELTVLDESIGIHIGRLVGGVQDFSTRHTQLSAVSNDLDRIHGVDPSSVVGLGHQMGVEQMFLHGAGQQESNLVLAQRRAIKSGSKDDIKTTTDALSAFRQEVLDSKASLADLTAAQEKQAAQDKLDANVAYVGADSLAQAQARLQDQQAGLNQDGTPVTTAAQDQASAAHLANLRGSYAVDLADINAGSASADEKAQAADLATQIADLVDATNAQTLASQQATTAQQQATQEAADRTQALTDAYKAMTDQLAATERAASRQDVGALIGMRSAGYIGAQALSRRGLQTASR